MSKYKGKKVLVVGFGLSGALLFGLGAALSLLGVLRLLQTETGRTFAGSWTFAPYLLTAVVGLLVDHERSYLEHCRRYAMA